MVSHPASQVDLFGNDASGRLARLDDGEMSDASHQWELTQRKAARDIQVSKPFVRRSCLLSCEFPPEPLFFCPFRTSGLSLGSPFSPVGGRMEGIHPAGWLDTSRIAPGPTHGEIVVFAISLDPF